MLFGEIVEPSTRALCEEDYDTTVTENVELVWEGCSQVSSSIRTILICESSPIIQLTHSCIVDAIIPQCELTADKVVVYKIHNDSYLITYSSQSNGIVGKVTEILAPWLETAKNVYVLTSYSIASLRNYSGDDPCVIRSLCNNTKTLDLYPKLEIPNFITGLSASVLSYCTFKNLKCSVFISYIDDDNLDSLNVAPILILLQKLQISPLKEYISKVKTVANNLYM